MSDSHPSGLTIGPYDLIDHLGEGGMGRVWRARHRASGRLVALKAITASHASTDLYRRAFRREVEAIARVDHPNVTTIFDFGEATADEAAASEKAFRPGSPWLAMELCESGAMHEARNRPRSATDLRRVLIEILRALAYTHARGILHRDLKPENILVQRDSGKPARLRIADFGISQAFGQALLAGSTAQISGARAGTPQYMAPEQIVAEWRNWGSWTDLYALGVIAYEWASGTPPFVADNWIQLSQLHLQAAPPPLRPLFSLPDAFHRWIHRLLAKAPFERYERASDALYALQQIEIVDDSNDTDELPAAVWAHAPTRPFDSHMTTDIDSDRLVPSGPHGTFQSTSTLIAATTLTRGNATVPTPVDSGLNYIEPKGIERAFHSSYADVPPMSESWERAYEREASGDVLARGVSLFGLREVPLIGRIDARDQLWKTLSRVRSEGRPFTTFIRGETGVGKSALARWFAQRADETGSALILRASHDSEEAIGEGLRRMLLTLIRGNGLSRKELHARMKLIISVFVDDSRPYDVAALTELLAPSDGDESDDVPRFRFPTMEARYEVAMKLVRHLARVRPIVIWLDDAHWSPESLQFAYHIMQRGSVASSIHLVITIRSDIIGERNRARLHMGKLLDLDRTEVIDVDPLPFAQMQALVDSMVRLEPDLRDELSLRAAGRPVHAVQMLGHLVEQDALRDTPGGYTLAGDDVMPGNIHDLWLTRVEGAMSHTDDPTAAVQAITLAALIGMRIDDRVWVQICKRTGVGAAEKILELFATVGLVERAGDGWRLGHDLLRYALTRRASKLDEWSMYQWMCADIIRVTQPASPTQLLRIAKHYYRGGFHDEVLEICLGPLNHIAIDSRVDLLKESVQLAEQSLFQLTDGDRRSDPRWGAVRANALANNRELWSDPDVQKQNAQLDELLEWAHAHDAPDIAADAHRFRADAHLRRGEMTLGYESIKALEEFARQANDPIRLGRAYTMLATFLSEQRETRDALAYADLAIDLFERHQQPMRLAWARLSRSRVLGRLERFDEAQHEATEAAAIFTAEGSFPGVAYCQIMLAQAFRFGGRLARAETAARRALDINAWAGFGKHRVAILALAAVLVERGSYEEAARIYEAEAPAFRASRLNHHLAHLSLSATVAYAGMKDEEKYDLALEQTWDFWSEGHHDLDVARLFALASTLWDGHSDYARARELRQRAAHYDALTHQPRSRADDGVDL